VAFVFLCAKQFGQNCFCCVVKRIYSDGGITNLNFCNASFLCKRGL
jgi:hypothetical protein